MLALSRHPEQVGSALWAGLGVGLLVSALGCLDFCRREVS